MQMQPSLSDQINKRNLLGGVKVAKNKVAPPFKMAEFDIMYGHGISKAGDVLDCGAEANIVEKSGSWYSYKGNRIGQGRENVKNYLNENPDIIDEIEKELITQFVDSKIKAKKDNTEELTVDEDGIILGD
jgi:recombination protein RecA